MNEKYVAGGSAYLYPRMGDPAPLGGAKVLLLTRGGICILGVWKDDPFLLGWAPLPKRDKDKETALNERPPNL